MIETVDDGTVTRITMDDGKVNALGPGIQRELFDAIDDADEAGNAIVLAGRPDRFSGGFDLDVMAGGGRESVDMVIGGFRLVRRLLTFDRPVVIACTGHAVAMGAFLLLGGDLRIGAAGPYRIVANEVAIGMTMPHAAVEIMRQRLTPAAMQRAAILAETFDPHAAVGAGFLDRVVEPDEVLAEAHAAATAASELHPRAHAHTKERVRASSLQAIDAAIARDEAELSALL